MSPVCWMSPAVTTPGPSLRSTSRLGPSRMHGERDFLDVEDDVGDVLAHAGDRGEFVQHAVDLHRDHGRTLQRGQQHAAQRVAERRAEAALERLGDDRRRPACVRARPETSSLLGRMSSCQFFWFTCMCHGSVIAAVAGAWHPVVVSWLAAEAPPLPESRQTRRRFGGRQPLCGMGVTSRIAVTCRPQDCSARSADSRPEPGPAHLDFDRSSCRAPWPPGRPVRRRPGRHRASTCASP